MGATAKADFGFCGSSSANQRSGGHTTPGNRGASWPCPMGSGEPGGTGLHITEKVGSDALVKDFAHEHTKAELIEYLAGANNAF